MRPKKQTTMIHGESESLSAEIHYGFFISLDGTPER